MCPNIFTSTSVLKSYLLSIKRSSFKTSSSIEILSNISSALNNPPFYAGISYPLLYLWPLFKCVKNVLNNSYNGL